MSKSGQRLSIELGVAHTRLSTVLSVHMDPCSCINMYRGLYGDQMWNRTGVGRSAEYNRSITTVADRV